MPVFPSDPEVVLEPVGVLEPWRVSRLGLGTHSGTHIDAASHYVPDGSDDRPLPAGALRASRLRRAGPGCRGRGDRLARAAGGRFRRDLDGVAVLVHTGWDRYWGEAAAVDHPYLGEDAATALVAGGVTLVGTDGLNVDATAAGTTHAHAALLGADVLIVENLTGLGALEPGRPYLCAFVPLRLEGADGSPIRAYAIAGDALIQPRPRLPQGAPLT